MVPTSKMLQDQQFQSGLDLLVQRFINFFHDLQVRMTRDSPTNMAHCNIPFYHTTMTSLPLRPNQQLRDGSAWGDPLRSKGFGVSNGKWEINFESCIKHRCEISVKYFGRNWPGNAGPGIIYWIFLIYNYCLRSQMYIETDLPHIM